MLYAYDNLDRVNHSDGSTLNGGKTAISTLAFAQDWTLDRLGNPTTFKIDADGDGTYNSTGDLNHDRTHNAANETGTITHPRFSGGGKCGEFYPRRDRPGAFRGIWKRTTLLDSRVSETSQIGVVVPFCRKTGTP